ncbi:MAG: ABC transporter substrate-binding protein [Elusimicrobia bacterium]|nr:ABC transporter substrate-binding protein [Elusimicrobiota bacterium]
MKNFFYLSLFTIHYSLFTVFFGCGKIQKQKYEGKKVITLWETYSNEEHQVFLDIVSDFEKLNTEIKVNVQRVPFSGMRMKLMTSMITHTAPDIARVDVADPPRLVISKSIIDITPFGAIELARNLVSAAVNSNIFEEKFFIPGSTSSQKHIFGIPDQTTGVALFYNREMFRRAGIKNPPENWDQFVVIAKKLTVDTNGDGKIDQFGFAMDNSLWWSFPFYNTFGVKFLSDDGKNCLLNSDEAKKCLQFQVDLYHKYKVEAGAWQAGSVSCDQGFINKKYAMIFSGPWNVKKFKDSGIDFGIALIPKGKAGTSTNVGGTDMVVLREAKHPKECYEFLEYLVSVDAQKKWCNLLGQIPVNLKAYSYIDTSKNPEIKVFMEQMKTAIARPPVIDYDQLEYVMNQEIYTARTREKTVEKALEDAVKRINEEILNY